MTALALRQRGRIALSLGGLAAVSALVLGIALFSAREPADRKSVV